MHDPIQKMELLSCFSTMGSGKKEVEYGCLPCFKKEQGKTFMLHNVLLYSLLEILSAKS